MLLPVHTFECVPPEVIDLSTGVSTPGFEGMYKDGDTFYVYMLEPDPKIAETLAASHYGRDAVQPMKVMAIQGKYTWERLQDWYRRLLDSRMGVRGGYYVRSIRRKTG